MIGLALLIAAGDDYEPLVTPDGARMLLMTSEGYFQSRLSDAGWSARERLGPEINRNGSEIGAIFAPSGRAFLFARDLGGAQSGEFMVTGAPEPNWPPACPRR